MGVEWQRMHDPMEFMVDYCSEWKNTKVIAVGKQM